jgi:hypothetical protein
MKKDNNTPTLQELLGSVEHAGRDARRQQQLAEMIERMAAEETAQKAAHRHTVRMWSTRIAVAATITLFLTTSIWRWSNMEGSTEAPLVAQNPIVRPTEMPLPPTAPTTHIRKATPANDRHYPTPKVIATPALNIPEKMESLSYEEILESLRPETSVPELGDQLADLMPEAEIESLHQTPVQPMPQNLAQSKPAPQSNTSIRGILSFLQAEPSLMEGTTLAINLL